MNKINVLRIVLEHFGTLRDYQTGKLSVSDICVFFALPLLGALASVYFRLTFGSDALVSLLTAFSIFTGLLFSLLLLVFSLMDRFDPQSMLFTVRRQLVAELYDNISFAILVSIGVVTLAIAATISREPNVKSNDTGAAMTFFLILLMANFVLTILMILKRMHTLLTQALKDKPVKKTA